jgi:hypothetical protein
VEPAAEAFCGLVLGRRIARVGRRGKLLLLHLQAGGGKDGGTNPWTQQVVGGTQCCVVA